MAYLTNRIGPFEFTAIRGEPDEAMQAISIDSWAGADGLEFTDEGSKAMPFSLFTLVDVDDITDGNIKTRAYKSQCAQGSVAIVKDGDVLVNRFKVLGVTKINCQKVEVAVGNKKSGQAGAILECRWDLIAVP